jgi:hypothetical protein
MVIGVCGGRVAAISATRPAKFFKRLDFFRFLAEMAGTRRDMAKTQPPANQTRASDGKPIIAAAR